MELNMDPMAHHDHMQMSDEHMNHGSAPTAGVHDRHAGHSVAMFRDKFWLSFAPYASWLNQVEIWFNRITQQAIRRGTFRSVKELVKKIDDYVQNSNRRAKPFLWTATAESIFAKIERLCERISGTAH